MPVPVFVGVCVPVPVPVPVGVGVCVAVCVPVEVIEAVGLLVSDLSSDVLLVGVWVGVGDPV